MNNVEIRNISDKENKITLFIPTNTNSRVLFHPKHKVNFIEQIDHNGLKESLKSNSSGLKVHYEHQDVINIAKNIKVREIEGKGFEFDIELNEGTEELRNKVKEKELQVSFGFNAIKDRWKKTTKNLYERLVEKLDVFELSLVSSPAYSQSYAEIRSLDEMLKTEKRVKAEAYLYIVKAKANKRWVISIWDKVNQL